MYETLNDNTNPHLPPNHARVRHNVKAYQGKIDSELKFVRETATLDIVRWDGGSNKIIMIEEIKSRQNFTMAREVTWEALDEAKIEKSMLGPFLLARFSSLVGQKVPIFTGSGRGQNWLQATLELLLCLLAAQDEHRDAKVTLAIMGFFKDKAGPSCCWQPDRDLAASFLLAWLGWEV